MSKATDKYQDVFNEGARLKYGADDFSKAHSDFKSENAEAYAKCAEELKEGVDVTFEYGGRTITGRYTNTPSDKLSVKNPVVHVTGEEVK